MLYRRKPGLLFPSSKMEFVQEYKLNWETNQPVNWKGKSDIYRGATLFDLIYDKTYGNDNLYYIKYLNSNFPGQNYYHSIEGNLDEIRIYQAGIWVRKTPKECYDYISDSPSVKGLINQVIYLDRTLVGDFVTQLGILIMEIEAAKKEPFISNQDIAVTVISALITTAGDLDFFSGIAVSLMISGLASSNNAIDNPNGCFLKQITRFIKTDGHSTTEVDKETGTSYLSSNVGLKITVSKKIFLGKDQDTSTVEEWDKGNLGKDDLKLIEGPKFYNGYWKTDSQLFKDGTPSLASDTIADIFGLKDYLAKAKEKINS